MSEVRPLPERPGRAAPEALAARRRAIAAQAASGHGRSDVAVHVCLRGGVRCLDVVATSATRTILYLHGGGYRIGDPEGWTGFAARLAERTRARIVLPDYRLAPEHPFPAALNDALAVLATVTAEHGPVLLAGDSAGGGLAAATVLAARASGLPTPPATILLSPWLDLTLSAPTFLTNAESDRFFPPRVAAEAAEQYLQGHPATDPLVSPLHADLAGFPPTLLLAGGDETLLADATRFAERLALAGTRVEALFAAGMQHSWPTLFPDLPETEEAIALMAGFIGRAGRT